MPDLATSITSVTVYPDRARVVRSGKIDLEAGSQKVEISELPLHLDPDSVRVTARGTARARLSGVQVQRAYYTQTPTEAVRQLEEQLETLQDELQAVESRVDILKGSQASLTALAGHTEIFATALASGETTLEKQLDFFKGIRLGIEALEKEQQDLLSHKRSLERRHQKIKNELEAQRSARPRERNTAWVEVDVTQPGDLAFELTYVVAGSGWKPLYDLRLSELRGQPELEVGYLAQVTQQTGEAWEAVSLTLSTARPALASHLPELKPWFIAPPRPLPPAQPVMMARAAAPRMMKAAAAEESPFEAVQDLAAPASAPIEEVLATVETSGAAVTYRVPGEATIPPDGAAHKVTIARFPLPPRLDYATAPRVAQAVYRRAKAANDSPYTLLPGQANLFAGDEYIGAAFLELVAPQGEIEVYLGVDDRVRVERELERRDVDKRLISGKRRISFAYKITLENLLAGPAKVTLHDQIPVSRHEDIKVKLESADPKPGEQTELNLLNWELELAPKEKRILRYDFSVESPQSMDVVGLP